MKDNFYRAFEDKHRGSRELIKERLRVYQPFLAALHSQYPGASAIDLGCGRGEWLELLAETGFAAQGVDLDEGMLAACRQRGLHVRTQDALLALQQLPDASQALVSGFHIAEHLPFEVLLALVQQAHRVLQPAGLLILETPNAENIVVGTTGFYADPTHQRPLPPALLEFLSEYAGFSRSKTLRLQEPLGLASKAQLSVLDVLSGASPDYAVVSQTAAPAHLASILAPAFAQDYGLSLAQLADRYHQQYTHTVADLHQHWAQQQVLAQQTRQMAEDAQAHAAQAQAALNAVLQSRSWRITAPLRWLGQRALQIKQAGPAASARNLLGATARRSMGFVQARPALRRRCVALTHQLGIFHGLEALYLRLSGATSPSGASAMLGQAPAYSDASQLSERAKAVYVELKAQLAAERISTTHTTGEP